MPYQTLVGADAFLDQVESDDEVTYAYQPGMQATHIMTAEALLCRMYLGREITDPRIAAGLEWLVLVHPPDFRDPDIYYWYYATQSLHHGGGEAWELWNEQLREVLVALQESEGHVAGSWTPQGPQRGRWADLHDRAGHLHAGSLLPACTIFRRIEPLAE